MIIHHPGKIKIHSFIINFVIDFTVKLEVSVSPKPGKCTRSLSFLF